LRDMYSEYLSPMPLMVGQYSVKSLGLRLRSRCSSSSKVFLIGGSPGIKTNILLLLTYKFFSWKTSPKMRLVTFLGPAVLLALNSAIVISQIACPASDDIIRCCEIYGPCDDANISSSFAGEGLTAPSNSAICGIRCFHYPPPVSAVGIACRPICCPLPIIEDPLPDSSDETAIIGCAYPLAD